MGITDNLAALAEKDKPQLPVPNQSPAWIQDLINKRSESGPRKKRNPVGFEFKRDPFDPSSYYKALGSFRDISRGATAVVNQEAQNREDALKQKEYDENQQKMNDALGGINPNFEYNKSWSASEGRNYKLGHVSKATSNAANYFGNKYGIRSIGGWREHGSVPGSDHPKGRAVDFMINNISQGHKRGDALANDLVSNYKKFNIKYVIWNRYIWTPSQGWHRYHGPSPHTDHVHASFNK